MANSTVSDKATEDRLVLIAAMGNSVLALPGVFGTYMAYAYITSLWQRALRSPGYYFEAITGTALLTTIIGLGFLLLVGYWLAYRERLRPRMRQPLWWGSTVYNGLLTAYFLWVPLRAIYVGITSADLPTYPILWTLIFALTCWTAFMAWLSIRQARNG
jgi:hypothetical protein